MKTVTARLVSISVTPHDGSAPGCPRSLSELERLLELRGAVRVTAVLQWSDGLRWQLDGEPLLEVVPGFPLGDLLRGAVRLLEEPAPAIRAALVRLMRDRQEGETGPGEA